MTFAVKVNKGHGNSSIILNYYFDIYSGKLLINICVWIVKGKLMWTVSN